MVLTYFTLDDNIVQNSISCIADYVHPDKRNESPVIVGGMAIQIHAAGLADFRRPTADVDLLYIPVWSTFLEFAQGLGGSMEKSLRKNGYIVQLKKVKNRPLFEVKVMNGSGARMNEQFFIHFDSLSNEYRQSTGYISEREAKNSLEIEYHGKVVLVKRIEDIIPYKLKRLNKTLSRNPTISLLEQSLFDEAQQGNWDQVANAPLKTWMEYIVQVQNECDAAGKKCVSDQYLLSKDLYDLSLIAQVIESDPSKFNIAYYLNSKKEIDSMKRLPASDT